MTIEREVIQNTYYKESNFPLVSGLGLPKDSDGVVRNKEFVNCEFHPNTEGVTFENCVFISCFGWMEIGEI